MNWRCCVLLMVVTQWVTIGRLQAVDLKARSVSSSKQFVVYCTDVRLRMRVSSFAEEVKSKVLAIFGESDSWKSCIVITLEPTATPGESRVVLQPYETPDGGTIQISVKFGEDPSAVNLQKHLVRAILLEMSYQKPGSIRGGQRYVEPPWWLTEGILQTFRQRDRGLNVDLYKGLIESEHLPEIDRLLSLNSDDLGMAAREVDAAYAMCLLQILIEQPSGRANLGRFLRSWPKTFENPQKAIAEAFPALGTGPNVLQKWWTLNVARFAEADRHKALTAPATEAALAEILKFELVVKPSGEKKVFEVEQFPEFLKLSGSGAAMRQAQASLVALSAKGSALFAPLIAGYERVFATLARGKTTGVAKRLADLRTGRQKALQQSEGIADFLNWYEATQLGVRSDSFKGFLQAAREAAQQAKKPQTDAAISQYLDSLEREF